MPDTKKGSRYTFDSFEVTDANRTAFEKAKQFAENADSEPLAIFGRTATGKTHLLYAVKNAIEQNSPELKVILTTTADMVSSLSSIISNGGLSEQFHEKYMQADVLLVDDIQELASKDATQDELILIFNAFYESCKRLMMTSSQKESHNGLKDRLIIRGFFGEFAVIPRAYINAQFEPDIERKKQRDSLLHQSEQLYFHLRGSGFSIDTFKLYFKEVWSYFSSNIGFFDIDREDLRIVCYLNRMDTMLHCKTPSGLESWEHKTCILFMQALIYTISSYDMIPYRGGFYGNGVLSIPMLHHAGNDSIEITIDEFEEEFNKICEGYRKYNPNVPKIQWRLDK